MDRKNFICIKMMLRTISPNIILSSQKLPHRGPSLESKVLGDLRVTW